MRTWHMPIVRLGSGVRMDREGARREKVRIVWVAIVRHDELALSGE